MKTLLVSVAVALAAGVLMFAPGSNGAVSADPGDCLDMEPTNPNVPHFITLPASGVTFDFTEACNDLVSCYLEGSPPNQLFLGMIADKFSCDQFFLDIFDECGAWVFTDDPDFGKYALCLKVAKFYYNTMRNAGMAYFRYLPPVS